MSRFEHSETVITAAARRALAGRAALTILPPALPQSFRVSRGGAALARAGQRRRAAAVITVSECSKRDIQAAYGIPF